MENQKRSCNRHDDCDAADAIYKARHDEEKAKPLGQRLSIPPYADHCHDSCCEDCFGQ